MTTYVLSLTGDEEKAANATHWATFRKARLVSISRSAHARAPAEAAGCDNIVITGPRAGGSSSIRAALRHSPPAGARSASGADAGHPGRRGCRPGRLRQRGVRRRRRGPDRGARPRREVHGAGVELRVQLGGVGAGIARLNGAAARKAVASRIVARFCASSGATANGPGTPSIHSTSMTCSDRAAIDAASMRWQRKKRRIFGPALQKFSARKSNWYCYWSLTGFL